jgi:hypothetical protein
MLSLWLGLLLFPGFSLAQLNPSVAPRGRETVPFVQLGNLETRSPIKSILAKTKNGLPNIVLIGYWPPTNEMLREFSPHPEQNPHGWVGENWEGRGYNIFAFFPEFPDGVGVGKGDFQVDYQSTSKDFWGIVPQLAPRAVLSFGRSGENSDWEIENVTSNLSAWLGDYQLPLFPTPSPPDKSVPAEHPRISRFPGNEIVRSLKRSSLPLNPFTDASGAGAYLCEFLGFHLSWYREANPASVAFAAHTHIGSASRLADLKRGVRITLRTLIKSFPR